MNCLISKEHEHGPHHQVFLTGTVNTPFSEQCVSSVFIAIWKLLLTCRSILECRGIYRICRRGIYNHQSLGTY